MEFNDNINRIKGKFSLLLVDENNNIVDKYEDNNLIVDTSKLQMAQILGKLTTNTHINNIRLGNQGVKPGTLTPKDYTDGFTPARTKLFTEDGSGSVYKIQFTPTGTNGTDATITYEDTPGTITPSTINIVNLSNTIKYIITIPRDNGNTTAGTYQYSEAGLYLDNVLFAMKVFPTRVKTNALKMIINWTIIF